MIKKKTEIIDNSWKFVLFCLVLSILLINNVNAETLISDAGVEYDEKILEEFAKLEGTNETFVPLIIHLTNLSEAESLISMFEEDEFRGYINHNLSFRSTESFGVDMTEEAFFKLIQDERVTKVYYNGLYHAYGGDNSNIKLKLLIGIVILLIIIVLIILLLKLRKRRLKLKIF